MQALDLLLSTQLNSYANNSELVGYVSVFFAEYSQYVLAFVTLCLIFSSRRWLKVTCLALVACIVARYGIKELLLLFINRPRPFIAYPNIHALIDSPLKEQFQSFPSGHALFFFTFATVIYTQNKRWGIFYYVIAGLMGIARVAVGVHYITDIISGAIIGVFTGLIIVFLNRKYKLLSI